MTHEGCRRECVQARTVLFLGLLLLLLDGSCVVNSSGRWLTSV